MLFFSSRKTFQKEAGCRTHYSYDDNEQYLAEIQRRMMDTVLAYNIQDDLWLWLIHTRLSKTHTHLGLTSECLLAKGQGSLGRYRLFLNQTRVMH